MNGEVLRTDGSPFGFCFKHGVLGDIRKSFDTFISLVGSMWIVFT
jgi:hypothetical protein